MDPEPVDEVENSTVRFNDTRTNTGCLDVKMIRALSICLAAKKETADAHVPTAPLDAKAIAAVALRIEIEIGDGLTGTEKTAPRLPKRTNFPKQRSA